MADIVSPILIAVVAIFLTHHFNRRLEMLKGSLLISRTREGVIHSTLHQERFIATIKISRSMHTAQARLAAFISPNQQVDSAQSDKSFVAMKASNSMLSEAVLPNLLLFDRDLAKKLEKTAILIHDAAWECQREYLMAELNEDESITLRSKVLSEGRKVLQSKVNPAIEEIDLLLREIIHPSDKEL